MALDYARHPNGDQVAYRIVGEGERTIVYVPGLLYPIEVIDDDPPYARFIQGLALMGRVVIVERRGIGASDPVDWDGDVFAQWADDVVCVLDALNADMAAIVGYAAGARVALTAAALHPHRVESVACLHIGVVLGETGRAERDALRIGLAAAVDRDADAAAQMRVTTDPSRADDRNYQEWFERGGRLGAGPQSASQFWRAVLADAPDLVDLMGRITARALIMHRAGQPLLPIDASRELAELMISGEFRLLPGIDMSPNCGDVDGLLAEISAFIAGKIVLPASNRPLRAVVFTDLVASTEQLSAVGDRRWRATLDHHDDLVRRSLARHGGTLVKSTGDGVLATFDNAARALAGAVEVRAALGAHGLAIRTGVHVGEVEQRGEDVSGIAVHLAARVMNEAAAGEIVVSPVVPIIAAGGSEMFESIGQRSLKGFEHPIELFRLAGGSD